MATEREILIAITADKFTQFSEWYQQLVTKGELIDYTDISGCYVLRPNSYFIWEQIQDFINSKIKELGVRNSYFPLFATKENLEKEKTHLEGFSPEVAWVTKAGETELKEALAIRPTSEVIIYPHFAKWIRSHRDLPIKINQWCNVMRYEVKHCTPFIRSREFLWQEGHEVFFSKEEADKEVSQILDLYSEVYEKLLAIPTIKGIKSEKEKFGGADYTTTIEAFIPASKKGIQAATSHYLGLNFSKIFGIQVDDLEEAGSKRYVHQTSWGITTRSIGIMIMTHSDNIGLVLPPKVAFTQVVIVPCGITSKLSLEKRAMLNDKCLDIFNKLKAKGIRVELDDRPNYNPGWKFNYWELRGACIRLEIGPRDVDADTVVMARRDTMEKVTIKTDQFISNVLDIFENIHYNLLQKATSSFEMHLKMAINWEEFVEKVRGNMVLVPWCESITCEEDIKARTTTNTTSGAKSLCIPLDQERFGYDHTTQSVPNRFGEKFVHTIDGQTHTEVIYRSLLRENKCFCCGAEADRVAIFGHSY